jgi:hypothetical protein
MPAASKLDQFFSAEDQAKLARFLHSNPTLSVDDFRDLLAEKGLDVGRSTAHEYKQKIGRIGERMRKSQMLADSIASDLDEAEGEGRRHRALTEMTRTLIFEFQEKLLEGEAGQLDSKDFAFLGKAIKELAQASRLSQDFEIKIAEAATRRAKEAAAEVVETVARSADAGLSKDTAEIIKAQILGLDTAAKG